MKRDQCGAIFLPDLVKFNHSCIPNCDIIADGIEFKIVAARSIEPGEEVNLHYLTLLNL